MSELSEGQTENDIVRQFREIANIPDATSTFGVQVGSVFVTVRYSGGSGSFLELSAAYPRAPREPAPGALSQGGGYRSGASQPVVRSHRPMRVSLRSETERDRSAKRESVVREFQTGDAAFDDAVYVDTPSSDEVLAALLKPREVRDGLRVMLAEGARHVVIDGDDTARVVMTLFTFASATHDEQRARRMLDAFAAVVQHVPYVAPTGESHAPALEVTALWVVSGFAFTLLLFGAPIFFALAPARCVVSDADGRSFTCAGTGCCEGPTQGLLAGALVGSAIAWFVSKIYKGRSDSHTHRTVARVAVTFLVTVFAVFAFSLARWSP